MGSSSTSLGEIEMQVCDGPDRSRSTSGSGETKADPRGNGGGEINDFERHDGVYRSFVGQAAGEARSHPETSNLEPSAPHMGATDLIWTE